MTKPMEAIAIVGALAGGVVLGLFVGQDATRATIKRLIRERDEARQENVGRLTAVYWQGARNMRMQMAQARATSIAKTKPADADVVELAEWAEARGRGDVA